MAVSFGFPSHGEANNGWKLFVTWMVMFIVAGTFVIVRCGTRIANRQFGSDDYAIIGSIAFSIFLSVAIQLAIEHGYGKHRDDLSTRQASTALKWFFIAQTPYKVTVCLNKISALLLYKRIFIQQSFQIACYVVMSIVVGWSVATIFATIFHAFWIAYAAGNVLTDVLVLALPIRPVLQLQFKLRQRLIICGIFLVGGYVTVTSILRTTTVSNSVENMNDVTFNFITRGIWTLVEANTGIICACLPVLRQPLGVLLPRIFMTTGRGSAYTSQPAGYRIRYQLENVNNTRQRSEVLTDYSKYHSTISINATTAQPGEDSDEEYMIPRPLAPND